MQVLIAYLGPFVLGLAVYLALVRSPKPVEGIAIAWGVGWASVNAISLTASLLSQRLDQGFYGGLTVAMAATAATILWCRRDRIRSFRQGMSVLPGFLSNPFLVALLLFGVFLFLVFYKGITIVPASTDAIVYHMRLPKLAFETGVIPASPGVGWLDLVTAWPNLLVTQQLWIYLGAGAYDEVLVRPIMPIYTALLLLLVFFDARRWFGLLPACVSTAGLFALNEFASLTIVMWAEVPVAFYSYLASRILIQDVERTSSVIPAGAFGGMAALVKYNGFVLLAALAFVPLAFCVWNRAFGRATVERAEWSRASLQILVLSVTGVLVALPFILRNWIVFQNPIYPFLFGGVNTEQLPYYLADYSPNDFLRFRLHEATILMGSFLSASIALGWLRRRKWSKGECVALLAFLLYLPLYLYPSLGGSHVRYLAPVLPAAAVFAGPQIASWILDSSRVERLRGAVFLAVLAVVTIATLQVADVRPPYLIHSVAVFVLFAVLLVALGAVGSVTRKPPAKTAAVIGLAVVLLTPGVLAVAAERYPPRETAWDIDLSVQDPESFLASRFGDDWRMWRWLNTNLPLNALVLTFEARLLYINRAVLFGSDSKLIPTYSMNLSGAVAYVRGMGVGYILDSPWSHIPEVNRVFIVRSVIFQNLNDRTYFQVAHTEGQVILYQLA